MIVLVSDAYSKPRITIRSHDLHVDNIRRAIGEITSYNEGLVLSLFFCSYDLCVF
jgi:hypothetical protein